MLDKKDLGIIEVLKHNSNFSTQQISKKTGIPITTVHNHIKKLEKSGVIEGYTVNLNSKKIGKNVAAYINVIVDYKLLKEKNISQHELAKKLKRQEIAEEVALVTGETDILLKIRVKNVEELDDFVTKHLRNIEGIEKTRTMVVLHEF